MRFGSRGTIVFQAFACKQITFLWFTHISIFIAQLTLLKAQSSHLISKQSQIFFGRCASDYSTHIIKGGISSIAINIEIEFSNPKYFILRKVVVASVVN